MANRISFSGDHVGLPQIAAHHQDLESSLTLYFSARSPSYLIRFLGYATAEVTDELGERLDEAELTSSLTVLASIEGAFRIDYLQRCYRREKTQSHGPSVVFIRRSNSTSRLKTKYSQRGWRTLQEHDRSSAIFDPYFGFVTGWLTGATGHLNSDGVMTLTMFSHLPI